MIIAFVTFTPTISRDEAIAKMDASTAVYRKVDGLIRKYYVDLKDGRFGGIYLWESRAKAESDGYFTASSREELFTESDVLSLHLRLNEETFGIVRLDDLSSMKPTAMLVNTSRAELIEPEALVAGLNRGRPGFAAIDVFESEPILQGHLLLRLENAVCTPHIGYVEQDSYELYFRAAFENVVNFVEGRPTNIVNPEALKVRH